MGSNAGRLTYYIGGILVEDLLQERREFFDLLVLIFPIGVIASWISSLLWAFSLPRQILILAGILIASFLYIRQSLLFNYTKIKRFEIPTVYSYENHAFLVPLDMVGTASFYINRAWRKSRSREIEEDLPVNSPYESGNLSAIYGLVEAAFLAVWHNRFDKSWKVETHNWTISGARSKHTKQAESKEITQEEISEAFKDNTFVNEILQSPEGNRNDLFVHLPPRTDIQRTPMDPESPRIELVLENPFVEVKVQSTGYSGGMGIPGKNLDFVEEVLEAHSAGDEVTDIIDEWHQIQHGIISIQATIRPKRLQLLRPEAPEYLRWAESIVDSVQESATQSFDRLIPLQ